MSEQQGQGDQSQPQGAAPGWAAQPGDPGYRWAGQQGSWPEGGQRGWTGEQQYDWNQGGQDQGQWQDGQNWSDGQGWAPTPPGGAGDPYQYGSGWPAGAAAPGVPAPAPSGPVGPGHHGAPGGPGKYGPWWHYALVGALALGAGVGIGVAVGGGGDNKNGTASVQATSGPLSGPAVTTQPTLPEATSGSGTSSSAGVASGPAPSGGTSLNLRPGTAARVAGRSYSDGDYVQSMTVTSVTFSTAKQTSYGDPPSNGQYVIADITIQETSGKHSYNPYYFKVQTPDGSKYDCVTIGGAEPSLDSGTLLAGQRVRGKITCDAPRGRGAILFDDIGSETVASWTY
jgi:hypothetical protein